MTEESCSSSPSSLGTKQKFQHYPNAGLWFIPEYHHHSIINTPWSLLINLAFSCLGFNDGLSGFSVCKSHFRQPISYSSVTNTDSVSAHLLFLSFFIFSVLTPFDDFLCLLVCCFSFFFYKFPILYLLQISDKAAWEHFLRHLVLKYMKEFCNPLHCFLQTALSSWACFLSIGQVHQLVPVSERLPFCFFCFFFTADCVFILEMQNYKDISYFFPLISKFTVLDLGKNTVFKMN